MKKIDAWHFVAQDRILANGSGLLVEPGYIYGEPEGSLKMCERGMHASRDPFDTLTYAPGPTPPVPVARSGPMVGAIQETQRQPLMSAGSSEPSPAR